MVQDLSDFYRHYVAAANARDFATIANLVHDEVTVNGVACKREDVLNSLAAFIEIMPDFTWEIEDLIVADDRIAARLRDTGTPATEWLGVPATGAAIEIMEFASYRVTEGGFIEMWFLMDKASAVQQLQKPPP